jgi:hypothetical protein
MHCVQRKRHLPGNDLIKLVWIAECVVQAAVFILPTHVLGDMGLQVPAGWFVTGQSVLVFSARVGHTPCTAMQVTIHAGMLG